MAGSSILPAAFMRGMSEKARSSAVMADRSRRAWPARLTRPGLASERIRTMPSATKERFSPMSSIISLTVPSVAMSV